jgi:hypothetical protein
METNDSNMESASGGTRLAEDHMSEIFPDPLIPYHNRNAAQRPGWECQVGGVAVAKPRSSTVNIGTIEERRNAWKVS